ncbi:MAG: protoporphyrinogen oxidase [Candidatus Hydrothermarchaeales archaeon]
MVDLVILGGGISGLATAYATQEMAEEEGLKLKLTLIEKEARLGGKIMSVREKGFLCEAGPAGFLDNKPETLKFAGDLNLTTLPSKEAAKKRFIFTNRRLRRVPESPVTFLKSDILSLKGRLRVLLEPFTKPTQKEDETIADFATRHLGKEAQEKLISSMVVGIFAGDSENLSLKSCFPVMVELEKEGGGSLIKAMFKRMKMAKKDSKVKASPTGNLTSFKDGVESLTDTLSRALEAQILTGRSVETIKKRDGPGYEVFLEGEKTPIVADVLILALPAYAAADVIKGVDERLSRVLAGIPYAPASVVCLGYRKEDVPHSLDGFGFLIPKKEGRRILGCRWDSSTFDYRAPPEHVLLWAIVGGAIKPDLALLEDEVILKLVKEELREIIGVSKDPAFIKIFRHEKAIPQYVVGHSARLEEIERLLEGYPGLFITGNAFRGVGINDCTRNAPIVARKVINYVKGLKS